MTAREISNVKTVKEMKDVLAKKLKDENTYFTRKDIKLTATEYGFTIQIEDYEPFKMEWEEDDYFGYMVWVWHDDELVCCETAKSVLDVYSALISIGYYVGTRF